METIEIKVTVSNDHSKKTDQYWRDKLNLDPEDPDLRDMVNQSVRHFDPTLDTKEFKPKVIVRTKFECEV